MCLVSNLLYAFIPGVLLGGLAMIVTVLVIITLGTPTVEDTPDISEYTRYLGYLRIHNGFMVSTFAYFCYCYFWNSILYKSSRYLPHITSQVALQLCMLMACGLGFYYFRLIRRPLEDPVQLDVLLFYICILGPFVVNSFSVVSMIACDLGSLPIEYIRPWVEVVQCVVQVRTCVCARVRLCVCAFVRV